MRNHIWKFFGWEQSNPLSFYIMDIIFRKIFRRNADTPWAVHFTSTIHSPKNLTHGVGVWPGDAPNNYFNAMNGIHVGDYTNFGPNVSVVSANHDLVDNSQHVKAPPIHIGKKCWIGANVTILPSVHLGDFTIVGAGSVVTKSFTEGYCVIAGNPAKIIKYLDKSACIQSFEKDY